MDDRELAFMLMHARAVVAEGTLEFLAKKLSALSREPSSGQIVLLKGHLIQALEEIAQRVEVGLLRGQARPEEERNLLADEFRAILEELKRKIDL
jgi:hypothetical protein